MSGVRLLAFVAVFDAIAVFILFPHLDVFAIGYLALSTALAVLQALVNRHFSRSRELLRLFYAKDIDPVWDKSVGILGPSEFAVLFEYAHWRLLPLLVNPAIQMLGLIVCLAGTLWLLWVDRYLVGNFAAHHRNGTLMVSGPYRFVRHPRYLGLLATRLALPLIFGSIVAWVLALVWFFLIRRRARLEERFLAGRFGELYSQYTIRTISVI
ncbi:MAG: isoprenylcysteine carboxylmethyltransferase family protein [Acidobacteriaceae bacterium]|nr:isoprenylcysteine carboxylmethyltransferase family protein [Acidobacteriaceae bacterium]